MKGVSEETKQVLASVDAGLKKLHTLDDSITLYEVSLTHCFINNAFYGVIIIFSVKVKVYMFQNSGVSAFWMDQEARDEKVNLLQNQNKSLNLLSLNLTI